MIDPETNEVSRPRISPLPEGHIAYPETADKMDEAARQQAGVAEFAAEMGDYGTVARAAEQISNLSSQRPEGQAGN